MRNPVAVFFLSIGCAAAHEKPPVVRIDSVGLFKNGLAVVRLSGTIPADGRLELNDLPQPVHGTFSILSEKPVTAKVELRLADTPLHAVTQADLLQNLAGKKATLHLEKDTLAGEVMGTPPTTEKKWNRNYSPQNEWSSSSIYNYSNGLLATEAGSMTFIKTDDGKVVAVQPNQILRVEFGEMPKIQRERPVLSLTASAPGRFEVEYLAKGLSWAPSYRIDLADPNKLGITQSAVIRNELTNLSDAEIRLISGYPSVQFGAVDSPLSARATWKSFFDQLANRPNGYANSFDNGMTQQVSLNNRAGTPDGAALGPADEGESVDLHYQSIGRHKLAVGEAFSTEVARAESPYERVVEWNIPDTRTVYGQPIPEHEWQRDPEKFDQTPWDAIVFKNPFTFPMTTGPAMLVRGNDFQGQQLATWTNPGVETTIRITKALSLSTRTVESEVPDSRVDLRLGGNNHYRVKVRGELTVKNHRGNPATMVIRRQFSGDLVEADRDPKAQLLESGVYSINKRNELRWRLDLKPGEEQKIGYVYEVLVRN